MGGYKGIYASKRTATSDFNKAYMYMICPLVTKDHQIVARLTKCPNKRGYLISQADIKVSKFLLIYTTF